MKRAWLIPAIIAAIATGSAADAQYGASPPSRPPDIQSGATGSSMPSPPPRIAPAAPSAPQPPRAAPGWHPAHACLRWHGGRCLKRSLR